MNDLKPCHCGGEVMHLIRDEEESIIECQKCGEITDIKQLWNERSNKHPSLDTLPVGTYGQGYDPAQGKYVDLPAKVLVKNQPNTSDYITILGEECLSSQNMVGYCPDCGVSRIPPFLKRCSRCCDTEEKKNDQERLCEENSDFYPTKTPE